MSLTNLSTSGSRPSGSQPANDSPQIRELDTLCIQLKDSMSTAVARALSIGTRLLIIHRDTAGDDHGGFRAALERIEGHNIPRGTAYRWINAAGRFVARHQGIDPDCPGFEEGLIIPKHGTPELLELDQAIAEYSKTASLRRLMLGAAATGEESRMDALIEASEQGDPIADEILDKIAKGELTLVQAIRARAGASATRGKTRNDPVYLDIDGATGEVKGLFARCLITMSNTFDHWEELDESAKIKAKSAWKALVAKIPKDLR